MQHRHPHDPKHASSRWPSCASLSVIIFLLSGFTSASGGEPAEAARGLENVRKTIEANGFRSVWDLELKDTGSWIGRAAQDGKLWQVEVDARGNFTSSPLGSRGELRERTARPPRPIKLFLVPR